MSKSKEKSLRRKQGRGWSALDTLMVLAVVLAIGGVLLRAFMPTKEPQADAVQGPYYVYFTVAEINATVLEQIGGEEALYLYDTQEKIGYVAVEDEENRKPALWQTDVLSEKSGQMVSAKGCMVCINGAWQNGSLIPDGTEKHIAPGSVLTLCTERAKLVIEVTQIQVGS